ncbi:MAG: hypothetical protein EBR14_04465, partial [Methylophilaceae bacterium]|nr:hypothetical protein [Methylophilaceae bacterium]
MEQEIVTTGTPVLEEYIKAKTNLPAKYAKFIQFGYFLLSKINGELDTPLIDENLLFNSIHLFNTIDNQQAFVNEFLTSSKEINKTLRKTILLHKKKLAKENLPPKVKKERKPRVKPVNVDESNPPVEKKGKGKKAKVVTQEDDLVNSLVQLAINGRETQVSPTTPSLITLPSTQPLVEPVVQPVVVPVVEPVIPPVEPVIPPVEHVVPVKKTKKPKENKEVKKEDKKEDKKNNKKNDKKNNNPTEEIELEVSVFLYNDTQYLIDDLNTVYDFHSHDKIGTFSNGTL